MARVNMNTVSVTRVVENDGNVVIHGIFDDGCDCKIILTDNKTELPEVGSSIKANVVDAFGLDKCGMDMILVNPFMTTCSC